MKDFFFSEAYIVDKGLPKASKVTVGVGPRKQVKWKMFTTFKSSNIVLEICTIRYWKSIINKEY